MVKKNQPDSNSEQSSALQRDEAIAPRWLSGGKPGVPVKDNPTAIIYFEFLERLSEIFIKRDDHEDSD